MGANSAGGCTGTSQQQHDGRGGEAQGGVAGSVAMVHDAVVSGSSMECGESSMEREASSYSSVVVGGLYNTYDTYGAGALVRSIKNVTCVLWATGHSLCTEIWVLEGCPSLGVEFFVWRPELEVAFDALAGQLCTPHPSICWG